MTPELYAAYLAALAVVLAVPGPTILLVTGYVLSHGRRSAWCTIPGVALGDLVALACSLVGLGAVLAVSAALFTLLKFVGAGYLVWLGVKMWRSDPAAAWSPERTTSRRAMFGHAFVVTALNPKSIAFFTAFLPQFINPASPVLPQMLLLGGTFMLCAPLAAVGYALLAGGLRTALAAPRRMRMLNRCGGGVLVAAGVMTAAVRRG